MIKIFLVLVQGSLILKFPKSWIQTDFLSREFPHPVLWWPFCLDKTTPTFREDSPLGERERPPSSCTATIFMQTHGLEIRRGLLSSLGKESSL